MRLLRAFKTERVAALALHVTNPVFPILHAVVAALERAPSHVLVVIRERLAKPFHVRLQVVPTQVLEELRMRHRHVAHVLGTRRLHALAEPVAYLLNQVLPPILPAELVPTRQTVALSRSRVKL